MKLRFAFPPEEVPLDPGFGCQPHLVNELLTTLSTYGIWYNESIWVPIKANYNMELSSFVIVMSAHTEIDTAVESQPPEFFESDPNAEPVDHEQRQALTAEERRAMFKLVAKTRVENENE